MTQRGRPGNIRIRNTHIPAPKLGPTVVAVVVVVVVVVVVGSSR